MSKDAPAEDAVAVVDDDAAVRDACVDALIAAGFRATGFASAHQMLAAAKRGALPGLVLLDLELPGESSFDALAAVRAVAPATSFVAFTGHAEDQWLFSALSAGCIGYVLKTDTVPIAEAVRQAAAGGAPMTPAIARRVVERLHRPAHEQAPALSPRELAVLTELAHGYRYEQIAQRLGVSLSTVRTHLQHVYVKLGVSTKSEAAARALRLGLVP